MLLLLLHRNCYYEFFLIIIRIDISLIFPRLNIYSKTNKYFHRLYRIRIYIFKYYHNVMSMF